MVFGCGWWRWRRRQWLGLGFSELWWVEGDEGDEEEERKRERERERERREIEREKSRLGFSLLIFFKLIFFTNFINI